MDDIKTTVPVVSSRVIARPRLLNKLNDNINKKLTLVTANAGWGKSVLLSGFVKQQSHSLLWYNVGAEDCDPIIFLSNLINGLNRALQIETASDEIIHNLRIGQVALDIALRNLLNSILNIQPKKLIVIFDDFYLVRKSPRVTALMNKIINDAPLNSHIIISSREKTTLSLEKYKLYGDLFEINSKLLKFTEDEIMQFMHYKYGISLNPIEARELEGVTEGWPVGVRIIGESLFQEKDRINNGNYAYSLKQFTEGKERSFFNFFKEQILFDLDSEQINFLFYLSIFETFTSELCDYVFDIKKSKDIIDQIVNHDLFVTCINEKSGSYRFHRLFKSFLYEQLLEHKDNDTVVAINKKAAEYLLSKGRWWEALHHFVQSCDFDRVSTIIKSKLHELVSVGSVETILYWTESIPESVIDKDATLLFSNAWALLSLNRFAEAVVSLNKAKAVALENQDHQILGQSVHLLMTLHFHSDSFHSSIANAQEAIQYLPETSPDLALIKTQFAMSLMQLKLRKESEKIWKAVESHPLVKTENNLYSQTLPLKGFNYYFFIGNFDKAIQYTDEGIRAFKKNDFLGRLGRLLLYKGFIKHEMGYFRESNELLKESYLEMSSRGHIFVQPLALSMISINSICLNDLKQAKHYLLLASNIVSELSEQQIWKLHCFYAAKALVAVREKKKDQFIEAADRAIRIIDLKDQWFDQYVLYTYLSPAYAYFGYTEKATSLLDQALSAVQIVGCPYSEARIKLIYASILFQNKQTCSTAKMYLKESIKICDGYKYDFLFQYKEKNITLKLIPGLLSHKDNLEFIFSLIIRLNNYSGELLFPHLNSLDNNQIRTAIKALMQFECRDAEKELSKLTKTPSEVISKEASIAVNHLQSLPPLPLDITLLGDFLIKQKKRIIAQKLWKRSSAKKIAQYLSYHSGANTPSIKLVDIFFRDSEPNKARMLLNQCASHIRKTLEPGMTGKRESAYLKSYGNGYYFNLPEGSMIDVIEFKKLCYCAYRSSVNNDDLSANELYLSALNLYNGEFLPEEIDEEWTQNIRDELHFLYIDALHFTASICYQQFEYNSSIQKLNTILNKEPFDEKAYLLKMKCYYAKGQRNNALKTYKQCKEILKFELQIKPCSEIELLYKTII